MKPPPIDTNEANGPRRRRATPKSRSSAHSPHQRQSNARQDAGQRAFADSHDLYARTMLRLRVCIGLLSALLLAAVAHAVTGGLTPGLVLSLVLTTLLLLASLGLWRIGFESQRKPDDTSPPGAESDGGHENLPASGR